MTFGISMMGGGMPQMNQMYGNSQQTGSVMQGLRAQYGCEDCFQREPYFANYPIPVQQVPKEVVKPSLMSRIMRTFFGG
ncbi:hypothetical protein IKQ21_06180 [bacterium]|nr:hypothetical protein [bacterium]